MCSWVCSAGWLYPASAITVSSSQTLLFLSNISRTIINAQHWRDSSDAASQALRSREKLVGRTRVARSFRASDTLPSLHCLWQLRSRLSVRCSWERSCSTYRCVVQRTLCLNTLLETTTFLGLVLTTHALHTLQLSTTQVLSKGSRGSAWFQALRSEPRDQRGICYRGDDDSIGNRVADQCASGRHAHSEAWGKISSGAVVLCGCSKPDCLRLHNGLCYRTGTQITQGHG